MQRMSLLHPSYVGRQLKPIIVWLVLCVARGAVGEDVVGHSLTFERDQRQHDVTGRILLRAQDGGVLFLTDDNILWDVQPNELHEQHALPDPPLFLQGEAFQQRVVRDLPPGFQTLATPHYLICYNTARPYAQWCSALFEKLYRGFHGHWMKLGYPLHAPETPLVAYVFQREEDYLTYAKNELGDAAQQVIGYYSLHTNRIALYDITGVTASQPRSRARNAALIQEILSAPEAERNVATVIHEATHQLAFNSGLQTRFADVPVWLSEGLAMFFESPDLDNRNGWRLGEVNRLRWRRFQAIQSDRPADSLMTLVRSDDRFRDTATAEDAYAEAWALCHFLIKKRPKQFVAYAQSQASLRPLEAPSPDQRLAAFQTHFDARPEELDPVVVEHILRLR